MKMYLPQTAEEMFKSSTKAHFEQRMRMDNCISEAKWKKYKEYLDNGLKRKEAFKKAQEYIDKNRGYYHELFFGNDKRKLIEEFVKGI